MRNETVKQQVVELLNQSHYKPMTAQEIAGAIRLHGKHKKQLQKLLSELVAEGEIVLIRKDRYSLGADADLVSGRLSVARSGNGYVAATTGEEVFVPQAELGIALPGDRVLVRVNAEPSLRGSSGKEGRVIRVVERARHDIVGTLRTTGSFLFVVPVDPSYKKDFYVADRKDAKENDRVVVRFVGWLNKQVSPEGEIVEVIGPADDPSNDTISIMRHYGFSEAFPPTVVREAEEVSSLMERPGAREDLRDKLIITIDPDRARDFDDALSIEPGPENTRILGVHIADVSHFVLTGSALDREAENRGNSVYLPDRVIPMLPEQLSNGVCSLRPDEDRLAFSVFLTVDARGGVVSRRFARTIIRSRRRLTYREAFASLQDRNAATRRDAVASLLVELNRLAQQFRRRRFTRFALDLDMPECEVVIGKDGLIESFVQVENDISHQLVEECMVAANEAVATELHERRIPLISRLHEPPKEERLVDLSAQVALMGFKPGDLTNRRNLANFLNSVEDHPLMHAVRMAVLRSMNRAAYSGTETGHYGLSKKFYAHFTSPIRRYPDLTVHRQLAALVEPPARVPYAKSDLSTIATHCTETEWTADEAERAILEIMKLRYLQRQAGQARPMAHEAVVVKVTNFGMFVELVGIQIQGLVHISMMSDSFVRYSREKEQLRAGKAVYKVGQRLKVAVMSVDFDKRRVDFRLA